MDYPFLYSFATSVLQKLDHCNLDEFGNPNDMKKDAEMLKGILNHLPSILETLDDDDGDDSPIIFDIQKSVFGLHDLFNEQLHPSFKSSWTDLVGPLAKFHPQSSEKEENLLSSLSYALPEIESQDVKANNLPLHLVPCLAYCALYPRGNRIIRETLVNQWMAEGFLELQTPGSSSISGDLELEDIGNRYFMELLSMGVFVNPLFRFGGNSASQQAVTVHSCEIHPLMHTWACQIAKEEVILNFSGENVPSNAMYLAIQETLHRRNRFHGRELFELLESIKTCLSFDSQIKSNVLTHAIFKLSELQTLDLAGTQFEKLPASLTKTGRLRYLAFSTNALLESIDDIDWSLMQQLQTLALDGCFKLTKVNIEHTSHMRHLYYTSKEATLEVHTSTLRILQLSYCSDLRSLSMSTSANFTALRILRIFECPKLVSLPDSIDLLPRIEELVIHNCARLDLNYSRSMDSLPSLQYMELIGLPKLTELPAGLRSAKALLYLMIENCISLRSSDHTLQHLVTLQKLCVYDCPTFSITPNVFESLIALQSLDIRQCPNITITSTSDDQAAFISHISEIILDGQQLIDRTNGLSREDAAALGPQLPSFGAQTDSVSPRNFPHFILSLETVELFISSEGMLHQKYKLKVPSKWVGLAQALKAIVNWRILQEQKLYCCLFPGDYEFERDTLFQLWMVRGFLPEKWEHHFNRLLDEEYIRESRTDFLTGITKYKINVGKVNALSNCLKSKDHYTLIEDDEDTEVDGSTPWHHVSVVSKSIDEKLFQRIKGRCKLRSVLFIRDYGSSLKQVPSSFFTALPYMQVLDLSGSHISELPSSIGKMTDLHFLDLSYTPIERIPESIHLLSKLQTLKLKGCKHLHRLPEGMKGLVNLYHLDFDVLGQLTSMPKGFGALTELRTLSAFIVSKEDGCRIGELKNMNKLCGSLCISGLECCHEDEAFEAAMQNKTCLTRLHLKWNESKWYCEKDEAIASSNLEFLRPHSSLTELQISNYPGEELPGWRKIYLKDLVSITFLNCSRLEKLSGLEQLPNLMHLNIYDVKGVEYFDFWDSVDEASFPKLETLTIDSMYSLECWIGWTPGKIYLKELSQISIKNCPKLTELPFLSHLPSLTYLEITDCKLFQSLPEGNLSTSLETLIIDSCPLLKRSCSRGGADWDKIKHVKDIWINMKDIHSNHEDTEDESESSDDKSESSDDKSESSDNEPQYPDDDVRYQSLHDEFRFISSLQSN